MRSQSWLTLQLTTLFFAMDVFASGGEVSLVDRAGNVSRKDWPVQLEWTWKDNDSKKKNAPPEVPLLRAWINVPKKEAIEIPDPKKTNFLDSPSGSPFSKGYSYAFQTEELTPTAKIKTAIGKDKKKKEVSIIITDAPESSSLVVHESCLDYGIQFKRGGGGGEDPYLAAYCDVSGRTIKAYLYHSSDFKLATGKKSKIVQKGDNWTLVKLRAPKKQWKGFKKYRSFKFTEKKTGNKSNLVLHYNPQMRGGRWSLSSGLGLTMMSYRESQGGTAVSLRELTSTIKVSGGYVIIPRMLDVGANAFFNVLPFYTAPSSIDAARFWGVNGRVAYTIPWRLKPVYFKVNLGAYLWGMIVSSSTYGISFLSGPQIFVSSHFTGGILHGLYAYLKFAPIAGATSGLFGFQNFEFAGGAGYPVTRIMRKWPLLVTLDISTLNLNEISGSQNVISLQTISLGASLKWF